MTPTPAVGRIVHVIVDPHQNNYCDVAPAIITRVWSDTCVNIRVLFDGPPSHVGDNRQHWQTSIMLYPDREALEAAHADRLERFGEGGSILGGAFWPPRV